MEYLENKVHKRYTTSVDCQGWKDSVWVFVVPPCED